MGVMGFDEVNKLASDLNGMSIAQLKAILKNLAKITTPEAKYAIKIIKGVIEHKKGR